MAEARQRETCAYMSALLAHIANCTRGLFEKHTFKPADFDPFTPRRPRPQVGVEVLKDLFIKGQVPKEAQS